MYQLNAQTSDDIALIHNSMRDTGHKLPLRGPVVLHGNDQIWISLMQLTLILLAAIFHVKSVDWKYSREI